MDKGQSFWDKQSVRYDRQSMLLLAQTYADTIAHTRTYLQPSHVVLDYACGTGITTVELAMAVQQMHAIDYSSQMIIAARQKAAERAIVNIEFAVATLDDPMLQPALYDVVTAFNVLCYLPDAERALQRIHDLLKPGGLFISATDCWGERKTTLGALMALGRKCGFLPFTRTFSIRALSDSVTNAGFRIVEARNLHAGVPNYFIAASKD